MGQRTRRARRPYYYQIRLGIEKRAQELDYDILRYFNDHPFYTERGSHRDSLHRKV